MAGKRIPNLDPLSGAASANDDKFVVYDTSEDATKRMDRSQVAAGLVGDLPYTPSGGISATTIPTAIAELDSEAAKSAALAASGGSALVGFLQSGTGATARTVQAKLRDTVSVKDFGAVGDGVTDDTAAIVAARTVAASTGTRLVFQKKTYRITDQIVFSGVDVDFNGCSFLYDGTVGKFAIVLVSAGATGLPTFGPGNKFLGGFSLLQANFTALTTVSGSATVDPPSIAAGSAISNISPAGWTTTVPVPGATPGGYCTATFSTSVEGIVLTARCLTNDVVTVTFSNYTATAIDLASGTLAVSCVNNAYHGVCLAGSLGYVDPFRVAGFTGVSVAMGDGTDPVSGVSLPGMQRAYYWDASFNIVPAGGFAFVCPPRNNENTFDVCMFPGNFWSESPPRRASCINAIALSGLTNGFRRLDIECNPSGTPLYIYGGANASGMIGAKPAYIEYNSSWVSPPNPAVVADNTTSQINLPFRISRSGVRQFTDSGVGNNVQAVPTYIINNAQSSSPQGGRSLIYNGDFAAKLTGWSDFSTGGCTISYPSASAWGGNTLRIDVPAGGRPNITQELTTFSGMAIAALRGRTITAMMRVRTNIPNLLVMRVNGLVGNQSVGDGNDEYITSTVRIDPAASTVPIAIIATSAVAAGGYVEVDLVTAALGPVAPALPTARTQPRGTATWNPPSIASGAQSTTTVSVPGAAIGDFAQVSLGVDLAGLVLTGYVSATDTVTAVLSNLTGGAVDLASSTLTAIVTKKP